MVASGNGQPQGDRIGIRVVDVLINHIENTNCGWDFQVGRVRDLLVGGSGDSNYGSSQDFNCGNMEQAKEGKNVVCILAGV